MFALDNLSPNGDQNTPANDGAVLCRRIYPERDPGDLGTDSLPLTGLPWDFLSIFFFFSFYQGITPWPQPTPLLHLEMIGHWILRLGTQIKAKAFCDGLPRNSAASCRATFYHLI